MASQLQIDELCQLVQALGAEEALGNLKASQLKDYCKQFGVKATGSKLDLIRKLDTHLKETAFQTTGAKHQKAGRGRPVTSVVPTPAKAGAARRQDKDTAKKNKPESAKVPACNETAKSNSCDLIGVLKVLNEDEATETLQSMELLELRDYCKQLGLNLVGSKSDLISRLYAHVAETVKVPSAASATQMQDPSRPPANPVLEPEQPATADVSVLSAESDPNVGVCATLQHVLEADCSKRIEANSVSSAKMPVALEENAHKELPDEGLLEAAPVRANVQDAEIPATDKPVVETAKETTQLSVDVAVVAEHDVLANTEESDKDAVMQVSKHASTTREQADAQDQVSMHQEGPFNGVEEGNTVVDVHLQPVPQSEDFRGAPADPVMEREQPATADVSVLNTESEPSVGAHEENASPRRALESDCAENLEANPDLPVEMPVILEENVHKELPDGGVLEAAFVMADVRGAEMAATDKPVMKAAGETTQLSVGVAVEAEHSVLANMGESQRDAVMQVSEHASTTQEQADAQEQVSTHHVGPFKGAEEGTTAADVQEQPASQTEDISGAPADLVEEPGQPAPAGVPALKTESDPNFGAHEENAIQHVSEAVCAEHLEANPVLSRQMPVILQENVHTELPDGGVLEAAFVMADVRDAKSPATNKPVVEAAGETTQMSADVAVEAEHSVLADMGESETDAVMQVSEHVSTTQGQADAQEQVSMHQEGPFNGAEEGTTAADVQRQPAPQTEDVNDEPAHFVVDPARQVASGKPASSTKCEPSVSIHEEDVGLSVETPVVLKEHLQKESTEEGVSDDEAVMADALDAEIPATEQPNIETVRGMTEIGTDASHARGHPEHQSTAEVQAYAEEQVSMPKHGVFNGAEEESSAVELQDQHALPHQEDLNDEPADSVVEPEQEIQSDIHALSTESDPNVSTCVKEVASQQCLEEDAANNLEANQGSSDESSLVFKALAHQEPSDEAPESHDAGDDISAREVQEHFAHQERDVFDDNNQDGEGQESSCNAAVSAVDCSPSLSTPGPSGHKREAAPDSADDPDHHHQAKRVCRLFENVLDMHVASPVESSNAEHCQDMGLPVIAGATSKEILPEDQACSDADNDRVDSAAKPEETVEELQDSNQESGTLSPEFQQPIGLVVEEPKSDTMILGEVKACECASPQTDAPEETKAQLESEELAAYTDVLGINKREADESFAEAFEVEHEVKRARRSTGSSQDFGNVDSAEHLTAAATLHHT